MSGYYLDNKSYASDEDLILTTTGTHAIANNFPMMANGSYCNGIGMDDSTMEIPLLVDNSDGDAQYTKCKCEQPGFAVNLKSKSVKDAKLKIFLAFILCCIFMIIEFLGGYMAGSLAIMADAAHLASDCVSFVIGLLAIWISSRPPDQNMSFGYKRIEVIGAVVSILGIWVLTVTLVIVAIQRLFSNDFHLDADTMMTIAGIGILINIAMGFILHGSSLFSGSHGHSHGHQHNHSHSPHHEHSYSQLPLDGNSLPADVSVSAPPADIDKQQQQREQQPRTNADVPSSPACAREQNLNLRAAVIHVLGDLIQSVGVFIAAVIIKFYPKAKFADPLCTLLFSVIVLMTTVNIFKDSISVLLDSVPKLVPLSKVRSDLSSISGVKSVHHLNVWNHTVNHSVMMVHLVVDILADSESVLLEATSMAHDKYHIEHSTIQIERA